MSTVYDDPPRSTSMSLTAKAGLPATASSDHREAMRRGGERTVRLVRRRRRPAPGARAPARGPREPPRRSTRWPWWIGSNVPPRIPTDPGTTGRGRQDRLRPRSPVVLERLPLQLDGADADGVAGPDAGLAQRRIDPVPGQLALEPLGRLLDLEVGLRREALDRACRGRGRRRPRARSRTRRAAPRGGGRPRPPDRAARRARPRPAAGPPRAARSSSRPSPESAEIASTGTPRSRSDASNAGHASRASGQVHLVEHDQHRLLEQRRVVGLELVPDDVVVPPRIARRAVHDVDQDPRPLDVAQERVAEAGAVRGALDEPRDVRDGRPAAVLDRRGP